MVLVTVTAQGMVVHTHEDEEVQGHGVEEEDMPHRLFVDDLGRTEMEGRGESTESKTAGVRVVCI